MLELDQYQNRGLIWYGTKNEQLEGRVATGFPKLDCALLGGLPPQGVVEVKSTFGIGELRLFLSYMQHKQQSGWLVFIGPPAYIDVEFLAVNKLDLSRIILLPEYDAENSLWAAEQCLRSGGCSLVIMWHNSMTTKQARRLLLACESTATTLLLYRITTSCSQSNTFSIPSHLSMTLIPRLEGLEVNVDKQRGGGTQKGIKVDMRELWPDLTLNTSSTKNVVEFIRKKAQ